MNETLRKAAAGLGILVITVGSGIDQPINANSPVGIYSPASKDKMRNERQPYHITLMEFMSILPEDRNKRLKEWADMNYDPIFIVEENWWHTLSSGAIKQPNGKTFSFLPIVGYIESAQFWLTLTQEQDSDLYKGNVPGLRPNAKIPKGWSIKTSVRYNGEEPLLFFEGTIPPK